MNSSRPLIHEDEEKAANRLHNIESKLLRKASTRKNAIRYQSRRKKPNYEKQNLDVADEFDEDTLHMRQLLKTELTEFGLSVRALNCLKTAEVFTLGELVSFKKSDMLKFRNFGKKSLTELEELVKDKGLTFGYDTEKYN